MGEGMATNENAAFVAAAKTTKAFVFSDRIFLQVIFLVVRSPRDLESIFFKWSGILVQTGTSVSNETKEWGCWAGLGCPFFNQKKRRKWVTAHGKRPYKHIR